jgi:hypothetical protein
MGCTQGTDGNREALPPLMEMALRAIGVVDIKAPPKAPPPMQGTWYPDGDIPH